MAMRSYFLMPISLKWLFDFRYTLIDSNCSCVIMVIGAQLQSIDNQFLTMYFWSGKQVFCHIGTHPHILYNAKNTFSNIKAISYTL